MLKLTRKAKIISSAYRVLFILYLLNSQKHSVADLITKLSNDKHVSRIFSSGAILKYIKTLKLKGFEITKYTNNSVIHYQLKQSPFLIDCTLEEIKHLALLQNHINQSYQPLLTYSFNNVLSKISRFLSDENVALLNNYKINHKNILEDPYFKISNLITTLEKYCYEKQVIQFTYTPVKDKIQIITLEPRKLVYINKNIFLYGYLYKKQEKAHFQLDFITNITQLPHKSYQPVNNNFINVSFKLSGKLAQVYKLYENETLIKTNQNPYYIIISSNIEDEDLLIHRLLKYGELCEILSPINTRKKMISYIDHLLHTYEKQLND